VANASDGYSHWNAVSSLQHWMEHHKVPGITGIDTRALTKKLREEGVMLGRIVQDDSQVMSHESGVMSTIDDPNKKHLVSEVSIDRPVVYYPDGSTSNVDDVDSRLTTQDSQLVVLAFDCGMKRNIFRSLLKRGATVVRVPWDFDLDQYKGKLDGVFLGNGPGDPRVGMEKTLEQVRKAIARDIPTFGICLGNQLLSLAIGGNVYKLPYGHRGQNQPCVEWKVESGKWKESDHCIITSQNHGYAVDAESLPAGWKVWFTNANDGSVEGIRHDSGRFFSVQFHPEATPGPEDADYLFDEYLKVVSG
jgi:carbamoyl-phosphate synthase small subunit